MEKILSNPQETFSHSKLQAIALSETHVQLFIDNTLVYEDTNVSHKDSWEAFEYAGNQFYLHIYFNEDIESFSNIAEWLTTCSIEICGLEEIAGSIQNSYENSLVAPMAFTFNPMDLFKSTN